MGQLTAGEPSERIAYVRMPEHLHEAIKAAAKKAGLTMSTYIALVMANDVGVPLIPPRKGQKS